MIIYNVTVSINPELENEILAWLKEEHIPEVMNTGLFVSYAMFKVVESHVDRWHNSYAIQYTLSSCVVFDLHTENHADTLIQQTTEYYGYIILAFRTSMENMYYILRTPSYQHQVNNWDLHLNTCSP